MFTELEAVNRIIGSVGIAPVASVDSKHPTYLQARQKLDQVSTTVQSAGLWFNRSEVHLRSTVQGEYYVPTATLSVRVKDRPVLVMRNGRLYDKNNRTYEIGGDGLEVVLVEKWPYDDLPPPARDYITARAMLEFFIDKGGQEPKLSAYAQAVRLAQVEFNKESLRNTRTQQVSFSSYIQSRRFR